MLTGNNPISLREDKSEESFFKLARERAAYGVTAWQHNVDAAMEDIKFLAGAQWPDSVRKEREDEGRPCLTLNKLPQFVDQVLGDQRQNRPAISVHPVEQDVHKAMAGEQKVPNLAGTKDYSLAEIYESAIRNIEYVSNAEAHYDTAFQQSCEGGFGWLRVLTAYTTNDSFDQDLKICAIPNRFAVIMDPDAKEPDYSDANWCFISEKMLKKEFEKRYPGVIPGELASDASWWYETEHVRVAEYFYREPVTKELLLLSDGRVVWMDDVKTILDELQQQYGVEVVRSRKVETWEVRWRKITAYDTLEKEVKWAGSTIPVVPVLGKEIHLGDKVFYRGLIRFAKDAQRMHNYWMTAATERVALAPKAPWVAAAESIEGYEEEWANANRQNRAVLRYNALPGIDRPQRETPAPMPAAELQLALSATDELKETIGLYDASVGAEGNETSGRAILARQRQGDRGTFAYIDNLSRAIRRLGLILCEMIPKIYDAERVMRLRSVDSSEDWVLVNQTVVDEETGEPVMVNDIAAGKFDVVVKTGPSYQTQRMEAAESLMQFMQAVPNAAGVIMDLVAKNMDWPGADAIAERLQKTLPPGVLSQQEMEETGYEPPPPSPEAEAAMAQAEADKAKAQADIAMAQAKTVEAQAKIAEINHAASVAGPDSIEATVRNLVAEALAELMAQQKAA